MISRRALISISAVTALASHAHGKEFTVDDSLEAIFRLCAYPTKDAGDIKPIVERFADHFKCNVTGPSDHNPRCCVWFELIGESNPGSPGWIFLHQGGGSICYATDASQMRTAVDVLINMGVTRDGLHFLPTGVITSFPVRHVGQ